MDNPTHGQIYIISAASGTGKTTIVGQVLKRDPHVRLSISHTTRPVRTGEQHGQDYFFVSVDEFKQLIAKSEFLEYAQVYDNFYGTNANVVRDLQAQGYDVILEIDIQGATQIRDILPDALSIFIAPPSMETLEQRLVGRGTDSEEVIAKRLGKARFEINQARFFDYIVINDDLERACHDVLGIMHMQRLRCPKQLPFIDELLK